MNDKPNFLVNSKTMFIEYDDIIRSNQLVLLFILSRKGCPDAKIFDVDLLQSYDALGLLEWYLHRPYHNICKCIAKDKSLPDKDYNDMLSYLMKKYTWCYSSGKKLLGYNLCSIAIEHELCEDIYIYSDYSNEIYVHDCTELFGNKVIIIGEDFDRSVSSLNTDVTYILSDPYKIKRLYELNKINCTSILLSHDCDYQSNDDVTNMVRGYIKDFDKKPVIIKYFNPITMSDFKKPKTKNN